LQSCRSKCRMIRLACVLLTLLLAPVAYADTLDGDDSDVPAAYRTCQADPTSCTELYVPRM
jgi:hypothetical protein